MIHILVAARLSASDQTSHGAHPATYTRDARSFLGVKRLGMATTHPHLIQRLQKQYSYTSTPPLCLHGKLQGELHLYST
jgi:hypothetical protein